MKNDPADQKARLQALEIAVQTIASQLRNTSDGFDSVAASVVAREAIQATKFSSDEGKEHGRALVAHLKDLLHVPDE